MYSRFTKQFMSISSIVSNAQKTSDRIKSEVFNQVKNNGIVDLLTFNHLIGKKPVEGLKCFLLAYSEINKISYNSDDLNPENKTTVLPIFEIIDQRIEDFIISSVNIKLSSTSILNNLFIYEDLLSCQCIKQNKKHIKLEIIDLKKNKFMPNKKDSLIQHLNYVGLKCEKSNYMYFGISSFHEIGLKYALHIFDDVEDYNRLL